MKTVFFDVDTQLDFMCPAGSLYVPGAQTIAGSIAALNRHAASEGIPILSSMDAHSEDDPEFQQWAPHCVVGTQGQQKISGSVVPKPAVVTTERGVLPSTDAKQFLIEKQVLDVFSNPNLRPLLAALQPERVVVYGVVSELCVECAAMGLLRLGHRVELVADAIKCLDAEQERRMRERFVAAGGVLTSVGNVTARSAIA